MWVQIVESTTKDPEGLAAHASTWDEVVGKPGLLGVTAGATDDGRTISIVRFESEEVARAMEASPEQQAWGEKMGSFYESPPTFTESSDVQEFMGGGSNDAGFVQVMKMTGVDRAVMDKLDATFEKLADQRPDVLGVFRVWTGADSCVDVIYFTSEAEARASEKAEPTPEMAAVMAELGDMGDTEYLDLKNPYFR